MSAVQIVTVNEDETLHLHTERMKEILNQENVKDKQVAVLSIIGDYNHGKSFLFNFFIRYLQYKGSEDWLQVKTDEVLTGFTWRTGTVRGTQGIWMWSEPFIVTDKDNKEIAVLLLDTQGAHDSHASSTVTSRIYALTIVMSSVTIFNLYFNLKPTYLHHLQLIIEYGKIGLEKHFETFFQKFIFLVRDWQLSDSYGYEEGRNWLDKVYFKSETDEVKESAVALRSSFQQLNCFLMTYPGDVVGKPNFKRQISLLKEEFLQQLKELISPILDKCNIEAKTQVITNSEREHDFVTAQEFLLHFDAYLAVLHSKDKPKLISFIDIAEKLHQDTIMNPYIKRYVTIMAIYWKINMTIDKIQPIENPPDILLEHNLLVSFFKFEFIMNEYLRYTSDLQKFADTIDTSLNEYKSLKKFPTEFPTELEAITKKLLRDISYLNELITNLDAINLKYSIRRRCLTELDNKLLNVFNEEVIPAYHKEWHELKAGIKVPFVQKLFRGFLKIF